MITKHSIQKNLSDFTFIIGTGLMYGGGAGLAIMAVVGTLAIDIVLLAFAQKNHNRFVTGFVLGALFFRTTPDPIALLITSPITTAIAVVLSVALGVPMVGAALVAGWAIAALLCITGYGLRKLAEEIDPGALYTPASPVLTV